MIHYDKAIEHRGNREYALIIFYKDGRVILVPVDTREELLNELERIRKDFSVCILNINDAVMVSASCRSIYQQDGFFKPEQWTTIDCIRIN